MLAKLISLLAGFIIAAISTCLILLAVLVLFIGDRLVGLSRLADF